MKSLKKKPPTAARLLAPYYPPVRYRIVVIEDPAEVQRLLECTALSCWGQGPIGDSGYHRLEQYQGQGQRTVIAVCKSSLVSK